MSNPTNQLESAELSTPEGIVGKTASVTADATAAPAAAKDPAVMNKRTILARRFFRNIPAMIGVCLLLLVTAFAIFAPMVTPWRYDELDFINAGMPPGTENHILGTNQAGADMVAQLAQGTRISLVIGLVVGVATALISAIYGCVMAYFGGKVEWWMLMFLELMMLMPAFLVIAIITNGRGGNWIVLMLMLIVFGWMAAARLVRSLSSSLVDREFVKYARFMGVHPFKIIMRHMLPNIASQIILAITTGIWGAILSEVAFSFLGIGIKIPDTSLGLLIGQAKDSLDAYPWMFWQPVIMLLLITGPLSLINDGLRDAFDPSSNASGKAKKK